MQKGKRTTHIRLSMKPPPQMRTQAITSLEGYGGTGQLSEGNR